MLILLRIVILLAVVIGAIGLSLVIFLNPARCLPECMGANLAGSTLNGADLSNVNLVESRISNASLERARLIGSDLSGAIVTNSTLIGADLSETTLVGTNFSRSDMRGVNLNGANLNGTNLTDVNLTQVDLREAASLRGILFRNATMVEIQLAGADLSGVELNGADLTSANLEGANLSGAYLSNASLAGANLREADLSGAWLNLADLTGADLTGASLAGATLIGSSLTSANFNGANLSGANAVGANFDGADLREANISGMRFLESDLTDLDIQIDPELASLNELQVSQVIQNARLKGVRFDDTVVWEPESRPVLESLLGFTLTRPTAPPSRNLGGIRLSAVDPARQQGQISISGSTTVYPITQAIANQFITAGFSGTVTVERTDTGPGFEQFCQQGDIDIVNASRLIFEEERTACAEIGRIPVGFRIGTDAIVVVVHPNNDFIANATTEQLKQIFTADSWSEINPRWPREPIQRFIPLPGSGTRSIFERVAGLSDTDLNRAANTLASDNFQELAEALANAPLGIGILDYATFQQHIDQLQAIRVNGMVVNYQNVDGGRYPLARPLYIYTDTGILRNKPEVAAFITYYLQNVIVASQEVGYFPASIEVLRASAQTLINTLSP